MTSYSLCKTGGSRLHVVHLAISAAILGAGMPSAVSAETLRGALAKTYVNNPTLTASRAAQRANDENYPVVRAQGLPGAGLNAGVTQNITGGGSVYDRSLNAGATLTVPIYQGGTVRNGLIAAEKRIESGQANLRATEASIFAQVVATYMDVIRDQAIVSLNRGNVGVLKVNLEATRDRFQIGDLTRTDIAQSDARLAFAEGQLRAAEASLIASRERYIALVGDEPVDLEPPPPLPNLPSDVRAAVEESLVSNPDIIAARRSADAAGFDVKSAKGARLPRISATGQSGYYNYLGSTAPGAGIKSDGLSASAGVNLSLPLYQGGAPSARVRQAQAINSQAFENLIRTERDVVQQTRSAFASMVASAQIINSSQTAVSANALSLEGVRAENSVGTRTILDILNAEQELLNAQVQLVSAQRNAYVAGFSLLAAMGHAEARDLGLDGGALYDPGANFQRIRGKIGDWSDDASPSPQTTRTVETKAQTADVPLFQRPAVDPVVDPVVDRAKRY